MISKRLKALMAQIREETHTQDYSSTEGLLDSTLIEFFNYSIEACRRVLGLCSRDYLVGQELQDIISGQESYTIPRNASASSDILNVEYSSGTSSPLRYIKLTQVSKHLRDSGSLASPQHYISMGPNILLLPTPNTSVSDGLRITYETKVPSADLIRGIVDSTAGSPITSITLDLTPALSKDSDIVANGAAALPSADFISVVDRSGNVLMSRIPIDSYNSGTGVITITSGFTPVTGETCPVGAYVVCGDYASSHIDLPNECLRLLMSHVRTQVFRHSGHPDLGLSVQETVKLEEDLIEQLSRTSDDIFKIPITDTDYLMP